MTPQRGTGSPGLVTKGTAHPLCPLSVCRLHQKSFAGPGFPALTFHSAGRWPSLGSPPEWPAFAPSGLEALTGGGQRDGGIKNQLRCPCPSFFLTFFFVKGQAPSA